ncbi:MAG: magnesium-protoporphyrin IX monomethyl ester (oxidative) cyclase, partial [Pseudomonadota bacterium]
PFTLDIDHKRWLPNLKAMEQASRDIDAAKKQGGLGGKLAQAWGSLRAARAFIALYTIPVIRHQVPEVTRLEPTY